MSFVLLHHSRAVDKKINGACGTQAKGAFSSRICYTATVTGLGRKIAAVVLFMVASLLVQARPGYCAHYGIRKVADGIYAAIAQPEGKASSNAMFIVTSYEVVLAGAHFVPDGVKELMAEMGKVTPLPLRHVILTHHHRGFNYIDFDLPANVEIITSWQGWQALKSELRQLRNPVLFFDKNLTLQWDPFTIALTNSDLGHSEGDLIVYLPKEGILFTSDLFYNDTVGYMGDGSMREWIMTLDALEAFQPRIVVPGIGKVTDIDGIRRFKEFFREFLTRVLYHIEKGDSLAKTKKEFSLPNYKNLPGYRTFFEVNVERAYKNLKGK